MKNLHKNIGIFAVSLLATSSAVYLYSPVIKSHADSSTTAEISVAVGEVMSLSLDTSELNLSSNPNNFVSGTINATVSTNSQYGYTLALEDVDNNTNLVHVNENISDTISSSFSGSKTSSEMEANTWGFSLNSTDFFKVPVNGSPVALKRTTTPMTTETETTPVDFGVKLGNITSGKYSDSVLFTMYVNGQDGKPTDPSNPSNTPTNPSEPGEDPNPPMQSFTCPATVSDDSTVALTDTRDGNVYNVAKLADGKWWMTQDLKITGKTITPADSDVSGNFTIPESGQVQDFITPAWEQSFTAYALEDRTLYSWYTATAGSGPVQPDVGYQEMFVAPESICPKGWKLPSDDDYLTLRYSYPEITYDMNDPYRNIVYGTPAFVNTEFIESALDEHHSYYYEATAGEAYRWTATEPMARDAYVFEIRNPGWHVSTTERYAGNGYAMRCMARC